MKFGIQFFSSECSIENPYQLLLDSAKFADQNNFNSIWTPERHFNDFGGLFPNPSVMSAALAMITKNLQLRSGSLISPLHDEIRIAEEWALVDQLSKGRVAVSFGSGWNVNDFVLKPERYESRQKIMYEQIETIQKLWRGETLTRKNTYGKEVELNLYPRPIQKQLPLWITSSGNPQTYESAGRIGANVLTHMIMQDVDTLKSNIELYRKSRKANGHGDGGDVSLMLHTFLGQSVSEVKKIVRYPFRKYLRSGVRLEEMAAKGGGVISGGLKLDAEEKPSPFVIEELLDYTFDRYFENGALMGTVESTKSFLKKISGAGVTEIACLIDFGVDRDKVMGSLKYLATLKDSFKNAASVKEGWPLEAAF